MSKELTIAQIWAGVATAGLLIVGLSKFTEAVFGTKLWPTVKKGFPLFMKWWYRDIIWKKELLERMDKMDGRLGSIEAQVHYNGGSSMRDAVKRVEHKVEAMSATVAQNAARRDITDLCSDRMLFRMNQEGACTFINDAFLKCFGWTEADVLDYSFENLVHGEDVLEMRDKWNMAIRRHTRFHDEQRIRASDGAYFRCVVKGYPILIDDELHEFSGTIDIIENKE